MIQTQLNNQKKEEKIHTATVSSISDLSLLDYELHPLPLLEKSLSLSDGEGIEKWNRTKQAF